MLPTLAVDLELPHPSIKRDLLQWILDSEAGIVDEAHLGRAGEGGIAFSHGRQAGVVVGDVEQERMKERDPGQGQGEVDRCSLPRQQRLNRAPRWGPRHYPDGGALWPAS